jgi:hypothetical protein
MTGPTGGGTERFRPLRLGPDRASLESLTCAKESRHIGHRHQPGQTQLTVKPGDDRGIAAAA